MKKLYEESNIQAIADAIRSKNGSTDTYKTSEMADAISAIEATASVTRCYVDQNNNVVVEMSPENTFTNVIAFYTGNTAMPDGSSWGNLVAEGQKYADVNGSTGFTTYADINALPYLGVIGQWYMQFRYKDSSGTTVIKAVRHETVVTTSVAYVGSEVPASSFGKDGDIYIVTE